MNICLQDIKAKYFSKTDEIQWIIDYIKNFSQASNFTYYHVDFDLLHLNSNHIYFESCFNLINKDYNDHYDLKDDLLDLYFDVFDYHQKNEFKEFLNTLLPSNITVKSTKKYSTTKIEVIYLITVFNYQSSYFLYVRTFEDNVEQKHYICSVLSNDNVDEIYRQTLVDFYDLLQQVQEDFILNK